ncbi:MAG: PEP-CTERM sorting domain-containing protein [Cyanobacteria bacterium J06623_4]
MINKIMKLSIATIGATLVALTVGSSVQAATFQSASWTDNISDINKKLKKGQSHSYSHDITDDGFDGLPHEIVFGYKLGIELADDFDPFRREVALIDLPGFAGDRVYEVDAGTYFGGTSLAALFQINTAGVLDVTVKSKKGDFKLLSSYLTAYGKEKVKAVPEPATVLGFVMFGLIGASGAVKRQKSGQA